MYNLYTQLGLTNIIILLLIYLNVRRSQDKRFDTKLFLYLTVCTMIVEAVDIISWMLEGKIIPESCTLGWIANMMNLLLSAIISWLWYIYIDYVRNQDKERLKKYAFGRYAIVLYVMLFGTISSYWTGWFFTVDEGGVYSRGPFFLVQTLCAMYYMISAVIKSIAGIIRATNKERKKELTMLSSTILIPLIATIIQLVYYGYPLIWNGMTIMLVIIFLNIQNKWTRLALERFNLELRHNVEEKEQALVLANQSSVAKTEFLSSMSHEIRTPMNAIIGLTTMLQECPGDKEFVEDITKKIAASSQFLLTLINDVLDMSKIESGKLILSEEDVEVRAFIDNINVIMSAKIQEKNIKYGIVISDELYEKYSFDKLKLQQVIINILGNAVKFTENGGQITLKIEKLEEKEKEDIVSFTISDSGIGISEEFLPLIFKPFMQEYSTNTTTYSGTGLGLAISKNIVEIMGGKIDVISKKGEGATFVVVVPLRKINGTRKESEIKDIDVEKTEDRDNTMVKKYNFKGKRLILAEDNDINSMIAQHFLKNVGFDIDTAKNGKEAVELFEKSTNGYYSAILMDIRMPVMEGTEATRIIRKSSHEGAKTIPIIAMTANAFDEEIRLDLEAGMNEHLSKPIDVQKLYSVLSRYIND